jgi:Glycosyl hydrolase family 76
MESRLRRRDGVYRRPGWLGRLGWAEHLWPVARACAATLDVAGMPPPLIHGFDAPEAIARDLRGFERYWVSTGPRPAYASDPHRTPLGGDRYYDDNAWVGLSLVQLERQMPGAAPTGRAELLFEFALGGWDERRDVLHPGGTFWVEQGRGAGRRNHDRNAVSNAPNAELGLHLDELDGGTGRRATARRMYDWVVRALRDPDGLYLDKVRGDGSIDRARWSYNQGSMIGAAVLQYRTGGETELLEAAEATARAALAHYAGRYFDQPPAFNAIFFRNLLRLHAATRDPALRMQITASLNVYADEAWVRTGGQALLSRGKGPVLLLDQSALVSVLALSAWHPDDYGRLA